MDAASQDVVLYLSDLQVRVSGALPAPAQTLAMLWSGCSGPLVAVRRRATIEVRSVEPALGDGAFELRLDGVVFAIAEHARDVLPLIEAALYRALHSVAPGPHHVLHAACVARPGRAQPLVLLGASGAGKSSFALAAIERGYGYFTDELTLTDGQHVWGVPRAIQFEPVAPADALPARLLGSDRQLYAVRPAATPRAPEGAQALAQVPVRIPQAHERLQAPLPASEACVVVLERAEACQCAPLEPLVALAELHAASFESPLLDLGAWVGPGRAFRLSWDDPSRALDALERVMDASPRLSARPPAL